MPPPFPAPAAAPTKKRKRAPRNGAGRKPGIPAHKKTGMGSNGKPGQRAGRKASTSVLDGIAAPGEPGGGNGNAPVQPPAGACSTFEDPNSSAGSADPSSSTQPDGPEEMSEEEQRAEACWNSAVMKVNELAPSSKRDYLRALKTYKVSKLKKLVRSCHHL